MTIIRPATAQDVVTLIRLLKTLFCVEDDFHFNAQRQRRGLEMMVASKQGLVLVAEYNRKVIGMSTCQILISTAEGGPSGLIEDVVVTEEYRGQGVGRLLIKGIADWARTKNVSRLQLLADKNNETALNFYKNNGWQKTKLICLRTTT